MENTKGNFCDDEIRLENHLLKNKLIESNSFKVSRDEFLIVLILLFLPIQSIILFNQNKLLNNKNNKVHQNYLQDDATRRNSRVILMNKGIIFYLIIEIRLASCSSHFIDPMKYFNYVPFLKMIIR